MDIEALLKLIEVIYSFHRYSLHGRLENSSKFKEDIVRGLLNFGSIYCNLLAPNVYMEMVSLFNDQCKETLTFLDIYCTLNSFGVHLIKDIWPHFTTLTNSSVRLNYLTLDTLMAVILKKVAHHSNENIPKNCIRDLLKFENIDTRVFF